MLYSPTRESTNRSKRLKCPFSFHLNDEVLEGRDFSEDSLSVYCPLNRENGQFYFYKGQKLKDCFVQIEGNTFYYTNLHVARLEQESDEIVYELEIDYMVSPEQQRFEAFYCELKAQVSNNSPH